MSRKLKWAIVVLLLLLLLFFIWHMDKRRPERTSTAAAQVIPVTAAYVCPQSLAVNATATASVLAENQTVLQAKQAGYITKIYVKEGQSVAAGQVIISLDDRLQHATVMQMRIALQQAAQTYKRNLNADHSGGISKEELDSKRVAYENAKNALQQAQINLSDMQIRAPFAGTIGQNNLSVGQYITPQSDLLALVSNQHLRIAYHLPAEYFNQAKVGQPVAVKVGAKTYQGKVSFVDQALDQNTQTFAVTAQLQPVSGLSLAPGQYVHVTQRVATQRGALMVPGLSVQTQIGSYFVFIVQAKHAQQTTVTLGRRINGGVVITGGLVPGQLVVTEGASQLRQGTPIKVSSISNQECQP